MPGRYRVPMTAALTVTVATLALAGCGMSDNTASPLPPSDSASPTTAGPSTSMSGPVVHPTGEADILAAYTGMWMSYAEAGETGNTDHPGLRRYAAGTALSNIVTGLITTRSRGVHLEGRPIVDPGIASAQPTLDSPTTAEVIDCADTSAWLQHNKDGSVVQGDRGGRRIITATVIKVDGTWKVSTFATKALGSC